MPPADPQHIASPTVRHPPWGAIAGGAVVLAAVLLVGLARVLEAGWVVAADRWLLLALRHGTAHGVPWGPGWMAPAMIDVTALGSPTVLTLVTLAAAGLLAVLRRRLTLALVVAGIVSGTSAVVLAKSLVHRPRPAITDHLVEVSSMSFPSGHAASSAIVYLTLAALLTQIVEPRGGRRYVVAATVALVLLIGFSRVYLGVHYPSDVVAGWSFGALWALAWWALGAALRLRRAGRAVAG